MGTDIIPAGQYDVEQARNQASAWQSELGHLGIAPTFPIAKVPSGGGTTWDDPFASDPESPDQLKELRGVIVGTRFVSRLYLVPFDQRDPDESGRPDAWSIDGTTQVVPKAAVDKLARLNEERAANGVAPLPPIGRSKASCPYNQFGSAALLGGRGKGKAASDYLEVYLFTGQGFPVLVSAPAGSIKALIKHLQSLVGTSGAVTGAETVLSLRRTQNTQGIAYSEIVPSLGQRLSPEAVAEMKAYEAELRPVLTIDPFGDADAGETAYDYDAEPEVASAPVAAEDAGVTAAAAAFDAEPVAAGVGDIEL